MYASPVSPSKYRRAQIATRVAIAVAIASMAVVLFATIAAAGKITANCATVTWQADLGFVGSVTLDGPDGTTTGHPVAGSIAGRPNSTYVAHFINGADGVEWGTAQVTTGPACDTATTPAPVIDLTGTPATPAPAPAGPALDLATAPTVATGTPPVASSVPGSSVTSSPLVTGGSELPATGRNTDLLILAGILTIALGVTLVIVRRGRPVPAG